MAEHTLAWRVGHEVMGPLLEAAVEEMNAHGPFAVDDDATEKAPRYAELVEGVFRVMSPASGFHGITATAVARLLDDLLGDRGVVGTHMPVRTAHNTLREPDVAVYLGRSAGDSQGETYPDLVPDLIVEVISRSTAGEDRGPKKVEYERVGVREYYLLDPNRSAVQAFSLQEGRYVPLEPREGELLSTVLGRSWSPASVLPDSRG